MITGYTYWQVFLASLVNLLLSDLRLGDSLLDLPGHLLTLLQGIHQILVI